MDTTSDLRWEEDELRKDEGDLRIKEQDLRTSKDKVRRLETELRDEKLKEQRLGSDVTRLRGEISTDRTKITSLKIRKQEEDRRKQNERRAA